MIICTGSSIGDCVTDTFTLSAPSNRGSPVICGLNTGQHSKLNLNFIAQYIVKMYTINA